MLLDGYWKRDLIKFKRQLKFWSRYDGSLLRDYAVHKMNSCFLYSAAIIRKIVLDEIDAKEKIDNSELPPAQFKVLKCSVQLKRYKYIGEDNFFAQSRCILSDYNTKKSERVELSLKEICNQFIHSYVWSPVYTSDMKKLYGALFSSDKNKEKFVYLLNIKDWITALDFVIENCNI